MSYKITDEEMNRVKLNSPFVLPDSPTERGMKPGAIKGMFWKPFLELMSLINKKLGELDELSASNLIKHSESEDVHSELFSKMEKDLSDSIGKLAECAMRKAEDAYDLASGKTRVRVTLSFYYMVYDLIYSGANAGDIYLILDKNIPDFIVVGNGEAPDAIAITRDDLDKLPTPVIGDIFFVEGISVAAIESGIDTSVFATQDFVDQRIDTELHLFDEYVSGNFVDKQSLEGVTERIEEVEGIAKGANQALTFITYEKMVEALLSIPKTELVKGQNIYIESLNVPDLWVSGVSDTFEAFEYGGDDHFVAGLKILGSLRIGHYWVSALETQKVDLTEYATKSSVDNLRQGMVAHISSELQKLEERTEEKYATKEELENVERAMQKQFEYICTVTVAPDTDGTLPNKITLSADDNGNPFELTDFYLDAQKIAITGGNINVLMNEKYVVGNANVWDLNNASGALRKWAVLFRYLGEDMGGFVQTPTNAVAVGGTFPNSNEPGNRMVFIPPNFNKSSSYKYNSVKSIALLCQGTATFVEGTTLVLWGVRK